MLMSTASLSKLRVAPCFVAHLSLDAAYLLRLASIDAWVAPQFGLTAPLGMLGRKPC